MASKRARLDRFLSANTGLPRKATRPILAQGRVLVDGCIATDTQQLIDEFSHITFDEKVIQANSPCYVMMNKPSGVVSATKDDQHKTVIDLLDRPDRDALHIVGRLDYNSTGLLLLTNDSRWSRRLMEPEKKVSKRYRVKLDKTVTQAMVKSFTEGMYFAYEDITTRPVKLTILSDYEAEVSLIEGRYHQIKRMFGRFQNEVLALHRVSVGNLILDPALAAGESRDLSPEEVNDITTTASVTD
jgi:16S rRNA pseudouridine516 synthase